jgi:hypothetical protein
MAWRVTRDHAAYGSLCAIHESKTLVCMMHALTSEARAKRVRALFMSDIHPIVPLLQVIDHLDTVSWPLIPSNPTQNDPCGMKHTAVHANSIRACDKAYSTLHGATLKLCTDWQCRARPGSSYLRALHVEPEKHCVSGIRSFSLHYPKHHERLYGGDDCHSYLRTAMKARI